MRFNCSHCNTKYQIDDSKIAGRALKMSCRKCNHVIIIQKEDSTFEVDATQIQSIDNLRDQQVERVSTSGLSLITESNVARKSMVPPPVNAPLPIDQWHVAINDVPVGPMKREEVSRKIAAGAVTEKSLCWREGFEHWKPLGEVPELSNLLAKNNPRLSWAPPQSVAPHAPQMHAPAPMQRAQGGTTPPPKSVWPTKLGATVPPPAPGTATRLALSQVPQAPSASASHAPTTMGSNANNEGMMFEEHTQISSSLLMGAASLEVRESLPAFDPFRESILPKNAGAISPHPVSAPTTPAKVSVEPYHVPSQRPSAPVSLAPDVATKSIEKNSSSLSFGKMIALVGVAALGLGAPIAWVLSSQMKPQAPVNQTALKPVETVKSTPTPVEADIPTLANNALAENINPSLDGSGSVAGAAQPRSGKTPTKANATPVPSATTKAPVDPRLARFSDDGAGIAQIQTRNNLDQEQSSGGSRAELSGEQINAVRRREQSSLQRCYEAALRSSGGNTQTVRLNVSLSIGSSGTVTSARVVGNGIGDLNTCLERSIKRWRFPASSGPTDTTFTSVFQPQ